ncbi:DUF4126 domain-containing protein [Brevundimonas aurifodinae]|uniref:DUF4126 domain-containing protein n=2 Tax=Brevundimonas TaxID=41275 RepID=A0ABV1NSX4_9CAUL|nr:MAG: hypothetical protein B7Z42_09715 [Brevundimonas sp. 12-68-7]OYX34100.1 MAG: hypothetical protein B7Z01_07035 [Brevundimonas subvibrioides]
MGPIELNGLTDAAEPFQTWILPALLGLGLASATGLRTFLPLLMLSLAAHFGLFGIELNDRMAWLADWPAIAALGTAAVVEFTGDKIPVVDHGLNVLGAFTRPVAGAVAAGSVFAGVDPTTAAIAGVIVGAPAAMAFNAAQGGARLTSTATTGGIGNPVLSLIEDLLSFLMVVLAFLAPVLVPVLMIVLAVLLFRLANRIRRRSEGTVTGSKAREGRA